MAKKAAAIDEGIKKMAVAVGPESAMGLRDRALPLFGFAGAFRRSKLVALNTWKLEKREEGLKVAIEWSKTDQNAQGHVIAVARQTNSPYCPIQALHDWFTDAEIERGALSRHMFRRDKVGDCRLTAQSVAPVVKEYKSRAGLDWERYAGHSLRSGFLISAAMNKSSLFKMADQFRRKSLDVLQLNVRTEDQFNSNAGANSLVAEDPLCISDNE